MLGRNYVWMSGEPNEFHNQSGFLKACSQDPVLGTVKLIAEPWDCGPGGYQVGGFPPGWAEWNDKYRDQVRDFWRGELPVSLLADRLSASASLFHHQGRRPWACVNFITAHTGLRSTMSSPTMINTMRRMVNRTRMGASTIGHGIVVQKDELRIPPFEAESALLRFVQILPRFDTNIPYCGVIYS